MASINYATHEIVCKVVYYGPGLSGKTTNLQVIHKGLPDSNRGRLVSLATEQERTLFFDFLPIDLGSIQGYRTKFQVYTVPGQVYYNATRKLVLRGVDGIVFVADSQHDKMDENRESLANLHENLKEYGYSLAKIPHVFQYNKQDLPGALRLADMEKALNSDGAAPSIAAVASENRGVKDALKIVASGVLDRLRSRLIRSAPAQAASARDNGRAAAEAGSDRERAAAPAAAATAVPTTTRPRLSAKPVQSAPGERSLKPKKLIDPDIVRQRRPHLRRRVREAAERSHEPPTPQWRISQPCVVWWGDVRIGRGEAGLEPRTNIDRQGSHLLHAQWRVLGLIRRSLSLPVDPAATPLPGDPTDLRAIDDGAVVATVEPSNESSAECRLWLLLPRLRLTPVGERPRSRPHAESLMPAHSEDSRSRDEETAHVSSGS
jgi:signal recognition particle receptor subunit beta